MKIIKEVGRNPSIDWIVIIFLSLIIAIILAMGGIYLYNAVTKGEIQPTVAKPLNSQAELDKKTLTNVIERFSEKEKTTLEAKGRYDGLGDPSM